MVQIETEMRFEKDWNKPYIYIDIPAPYEENYQMRMLKHNKMKGIIKVSGSGREGESRYTYYTEGGISLEKKYQKAVLDKRTIESFVTQFTDVVEEVRNHMLDPDCILIGPEYIFEKEGKYRFCYLPVSHRSLYRSFHEMTEFFLQKLDYRDTEGIFLAHMLHRATLQESYNIKEIMEEYHREEKNREPKKDGEESLTEGTVFSLEEDTISGTEETSYHIRSDNTAIMEEKKRYGPLKRMMGRIRTGRWGDWDDLITEMDGQEEGGHL